jgi:opacity protein-like surface antigen
MFKSEVSVGARQLRQEDAQDEIQQSTDNTAGVLSSYRFYFDRHNGVEANYAWVQNTENYATVAELKANVNEASAAYVFRMPMKRWSPFVLAGAGALVFDPKDFRGANTQARPAFVYGGGADINVTDHFFIRGEYRGFVYNSPTFDLAGLNGLDRITHRANPPSVSAGGSKIATTHKSRLHREIA